SGTLRENLLYGLKHAPLRPAPGDPAAGRRRRLALIEAGRAGTPHLDLASDWIDYASAGAAAREDLLGAVRPVLDAVTSSKDSLGLALRATSGPDPQGDLAGRVVAMRAALRRQVEADGLGGLIVPFEPDSYNSEATL